MKTITKRILTSLLFIWASLVTVRAYEVSNAYDNKGNILSRSETGTFSYGLGSKPYALTGVGTATYMYMQSPSNHAYFGEPIISTKDLLIGTAFGAFTAGAINGSAAAYEGKNFWTGEMIAEGKGVLSFNNSPKTKFNSSGFNFEDPGLPEPSPKVREIANKFSTGKNIPLNDYQESHFVFEEGGYKMDFRVETQARLDRVFKSPDILRTTKVRHMNVQLYKWNGIQYDEIPVPGYGKKNYHLFLNIKK